MGGAALRTLSGDVHIDRSRFSRNSGRLGAGGALGIEGGTVYVSETTFDGNIAEGGGGAILVSEGAALFLENSAVADNRAFLSSPGGLLNLGTATVRNSTFARNRSDDTSVGRLANDIESFGVLDLVSSTLVGGAANLGGGGAAVLVGRGPTTVLNTIITHDPTEPRTQDCVGRLTSLGHNLISDPTGCTIELQPTDRTGDAGLGDLADTGEPGGIHLPLLPSSPAVNAGDIGGCSPTDQIGQRRLGPCDIGAIEFRPPRLTVSPRRTVVGGTVAVTWSGVAVPNATDWIGLFRPGTDNRQFLDWFYVSCSQIPDNAQAFGSCSYSVPSRLSPGRYELRLLANDGFAELLDSIVLHID